MTPDSRLPESDVAADIGGPDRGPTRRRAIVLAGGTAAALGAAAGPFAHLIGAETAQGNQSPDITLAMWLVSLELAARSVYATAAKADAFDDRAKSLATTCGANHGAQGTALGAMVTAGGGTVPTDANSVLAMQFSNRFATAATAAAKAGVLEDLENGLAATYQASLATLRSAPIAAVAAQIIASDAAQAVAWAAIANGPTADAPLPKPDAIPASQTTDAQFDRTEFTPATTTTTGSTS
ncbi:MAG: ferritin-like domain-containing protein [Actinobacteria bacterium]|nr:ferritin-like domain-containing protein [Actinomycetota bacterium]